MTGYSACSATEASGWAPSTSASPLPLPHCPALPPPLPPCPVSDPMPYLCPAQHSLATPAVGALAPARAAYVGMTHGPLVSVPIPCGFLALPSALRSAGPCAGRSPGRRQRRGAEPPPLPAALPCHCR
eukprot:EG_transcript_30976